MAVLKMRGRARGETDIRERILAAAAEEFGESGYDDATIPAIAARAEVETAVVEQHFAKKADLFAEVMDIPLRPDLAIPKILSGPRDAVGERIVRFVLETFERPEIKRRGVTMMRSALSSKLTTPVLSGFLSRELIGRLARELDADDAELRAGLVASEIGGLLVTRYVLKLGALADAKVDDLVTRIGPAVQRHLFD